MAEKSSKPSGFLETVGAPASGMRPGASLGDAGGRPRLTIARSPRAAAAGQEPPASRLGHSRRFEVRFQRADLIVDMPFPASNAWSASSAAVSSASAAGARTPPLAAPNDSTSSSTDGSGASSATRDRGWRRRWSRPDQPP